MTWAVSERRACGVIELWRRTKRYVSIRDPQDALRIRLKDLAASRVRYGYRRLHVLLKREGWAGEPQAGLPTLWSGESGDAD